MQLFSLRVQYYISNYTKQEEKEKKASLNNLQKRNLNKDIGDFNGIKMLLFYDFSL